MFSLFRFQIIIIFFIQSCIAMTLDEFDVYCDNGLSAFESITKNDPQLIRELASSYFLTNLDTPTGINAFHRVAMRYDDISSSKIIELIDFFFTHGGDINQPDAKGNYLIHYAIQTINLDLVKKLIQMNAIINIQNENNLFPMELIDRMIPQDSSYYQEEDRIALLEIRALLEYPFPVHRHTQTCCHEQVF